MDSISAMPISSISSRKLSNLRQHTPIKRGWAIPPILFLFQMALFQNHMKRKIPDSKEN